MAVSGRARSRISAFIREEERGRSYDLGREILDKELKKHSLSLNSLLKDGRLGAILEELNFKDVNQLCSAVAHTKITPQAVLTRLRAQGEEHKADALPSIPETGKSRGSGAIKVRGVEDVLTRFARCCTPLPGEAITGFITRGRGISVHRSDCPLLLEVEQERLLEVQWDENIPTLRPVRLQLEAANAPGVFADIAQTLKAKSINIEKINTRKAVNNVMVIDLVLNIKNSDQLKHITAEIYNLKGVLSVTRTSL
jgi:GTP pyrophosphokinase